MKALLLVLALPLATTFAETELVLSADRTECFPGETINLTLRLIGTEIEPRVTSTEDYTSITNIGLQMLTPGGTANTLSNTFSIQPKEVGEHTVGPFSIQIAGNTLVSNELRFTVAMAASGDKTITLSAPVARVGDQIKVQVVSTASDLGDLSLKPNPLFVVESTSTGTTRQFSNGKATVTYNKSLEIKLLKPGTIVFDSQLFEGFEGLLSAAAPELVVNR